MPVRLKGHKYKAKPTVVDGIRFASKKEAARYRELRLLEKAGEIAALQWQVPYELKVPRIAVPPGDPEMLTQRTPRVIGKYVADFIYYQRGDFIVEDVKGFDVPLGRWKRRHAEAQYGITIRLIK